MVYLTLSFPVSFVWEQHISPPCARCLPFPRGKGEECEQTDLFQFPARSLAGDHFPCSTIPPHSYQSLVPLFHWVSDLEASPVYKTYVEYIHMPSPTNLSFVVESHMEKDIFFPWWHI